MEPTDAIIDLIASGERVLLRSRDVVWEAHLQSCVAGTIVAAARPLGAERPFAEEHFELADVAELVPYETSVDEEPESELSKMAADLAAQAELPLAERMIHKHMRGGPHGSSSHRPRDG